MDSKLTLKLESEVIRKAKEYAKKNKTSLSRMIESYLKSLTKGQEKQTEVTPLVKSLSGIIKPAQGDYRKKYTDFLQKKYK